MAIIVRLEETETEVKVTISGEGDPNTYVWALVSILLMACVLLSLISSENLHFSSPLEVLLFLIVLPAFLVVGIVQFGKVFLWHNSGEEVIWVSRESLTLQRTAAGFQDVKVLTLSSIRRLRVEPKEHDLGRRYTHLKPTGVGLPHNVGRLAFESGKSTYRFGVGLSDREAKAVYDHLTKRFPSLQSDGR